MQVLVFLGIKEANVSQEVFNLHGWVVQSRVKITQGLCKISIQIRKLKKQIQFYSFCPKFDDLML